MKLNIDKLKSECSDYENVIALLLDTLNLTSIPDIYYCAQLRLIYLRHNLIQDIVPLSFCKNLWIIDLSQNRINSVESLVHYKALGYLNLSHNNTLQAAALQKIRKLQVIDFEMVVKNISRETIVQTMVNCWIVNGKYVDLKSRNSQL